MPMDASSRMAMDAAKCSTTSTVTAIEKDLPFEIVSRLAEVESWRKEVHRLVYHLHK